MKGPIISAQNNALMTWHWDVPNDILVFSEQFCERVGHRPEGHPIRFEFLCRLIHPDDLAPFRAAVLASLTKADTPFALELRTLTRWGEARAHRMGGEVSRRSVTGLALEVTGWLLD